MPKFKKYDPTWRTQTTYAQSELRRRKSLKRSFSEFVFENFEYMQNCEPSTELYGDYRAFCAERHFPNYNFLGFCVAMERLLPIVKIIMKEFE